MPEETGLDADLIEEFIDDYFAECDEHLATVRANLLALESSIGGHRPDDDNLIDALMRAFHSIKGLSGMVGVGAAEGLAHHVESALRLLRHDALPLTPDLYQALTDAAILMEAVIAARRARRTLPDIGPAVTQLGASGPAVARIRENRPVPVLPAPGPANTAAPAGPAGSVALPELSLPAHANEKLATALARGEHAWQVVFESSAERANRGVNVNSVRSRLSGMGEVLHAAPRVTETGGVVFDFLLITAAGASGFAGLENEGLRWAPYGGETRLPKRAGAAALGTPQSGGSSRPVSPSPASGPGAGPRAAFSSNGGHASTAEPAQAAAQYGDAEDHAAAPVADAAPAAGAAAVDPGTAAAAPASMVRVDLARLDELMQWVGELVISRSRLSERLRRLERLLPAAEWRELHDTGLLMERQLRDLRGAAMRVRLVPVGEVFARMQFVVRDLARTNGKKVSLEFTGHETEIDKLVVDRMMDPVMHLVRNAVSHGLESPHERTAAGKPETGRLSLRARTAGDLVQIEVEDDGRGIDVERVAATARAQGLLRTDEKLDPERLLDLICAPGFSTRSEADLTSGRGVGMAVVLGAVRQLGGTLSLVTRPGQGTCFTIQLPLTLAILDALIVATGDQTFAVPQLSLREVIELPPLLQSPSTGEMVPYRGAALPILRLARLLGLPTAELQAPRYALVVGQGGAAAGFAFDRILGQREIVVRAMPDPLLQVPGIAGATELGDGRPVLILDSAGLLRMSQTRS